MKVLILVLASNDQPWKYLREEGQEKTWDSLEIDGVETIYYFSGPDFKHEGKYLTLSCPNEFYMMHWRFKLALDYVWGMEWDYIFRTSASSYIDKELLLTKAMTLPPEKCYCGIECGGRSAASGCGFFISRDCALILKEQIPESLIGIEWKHPDDIVIGQVLERNGIGVTPGAERYDFFHNTSPVPNIYHYRCKTDALVRGENNWPDDGNEDVKAMKYVHLYKLSQ